MFEHIEAYPGDPILSLNEDFQKDPRPQKVNLSIGIYFNGEGKLQMMRAVADAEARVAKETGPRPYIPMSGLQSYRDHVHKLVFGAAVSPDLVASLQTIGASGALKVGSDFLKRYFPASKVWISDPSWENHRTVFEGSGFDVDVYPYYDAEDGGLRFDDMIKSLGSLPARSVVLLHACCHNPTGVDLSKSQWDRLAELFLERGLIAFIDMAYQGFGDDIVSDAYGPQAFAAAGVPALVANSFSKNFSIYGERCGGLSVVCRSAEERQCVQGQLTATVRANYSNPPTHGAKIIATVLGDDDLRTAWHGELDEMRDRLKAMRQAIHDRLKKCGVTDDLSRYLTQRGMFTYTGLSADQVDRLREEFGVYILRSGRMCVAGLNASNVDVVADAIAKVMAED
ncbi:MULTISPECIES: amino acid aminotransferase [Variovorax]|uniref:Aromatic-amino-acid transaminase n=1 Tax=Variovorax paradoxus TaxID=34073 RepID=A0AAE4BZF2_VARPD|nr:amino acid aminotransferase [Variovorax paradoxus]MDR6428029.1 aromatic-amino-acid transaminase [Variovorax paradoxus]